MMQDSSSIPSRKDIDAAAISLEPLIVTPPN